MASNIPLVMDGAYKAMFNVRGHSYDQAMQFCPFAREQEFNQLFNGVDVSHLNRVLDIPSGGGYLQQYLDADSQLDSLDPCDNFKAIGGGCSIDLDQIALRTDHYDAVVCLAALHHISNKQAFIAALMAALRDKGSLLMADVAAGSGEAAFLDQFAGRYNQTGHRGDYLSAESVPDYLHNAATTELIAYEKRDCHWQFADQRHMLRFCRLLFGLQQDCDKALLQALEDLVGVTLDSGSCQLHWRLLYVHCKKSPASAPL